ncbi:hypothetical protein [Blautia celeris]|uniref:hypothetical protein n=1 Tax=Blautia celeris TaxID=2763026 RepID=UPI00210E2311|nr:hypothetical protein [Blautia producta]
MRQLKSIVYNKNYKSKIIIVLLISVILGFIGYYKNVFIFEYPQNADDYHMNILTINSILSGFSLTNLGILISISDAQLIKKLEGTDLLNKRNVVISYSIIFGSMSIAASLLFIFKINIAGASIFKNDGVLFMFKNIVYTIEMISLFLSIIYFMLSVKKMIQLLSHIYIPKKSYSKEKEEKIRKQMENNRNKF